MAELQVVRPSVVTLECLAETRLFLATPLHGTVMSWVDGYWPPKSKTPVEVVTRLAPPPCDGAGVVFDYLASLDQMLIYGGHTEAWYEAYDTWAFQGRRWLPFTGTGPKVSGTRMQMVADEHRRRIVLYGGQTPNLGFSTETWEWDGASWTSFALPGPGGRQAHAMAFDSSRNKVMLLGGYGQSVRYNDLWEYDAKTTHWQQVATGGPAPRSAAALAWDPVRQKTLLFGGEGNASVFTDTWEWDGTTWRHARVNRCLQQAGTDNATAMARHFSRRFTRAFCHFVDAWANAPRGFSSPHGHFLRARSCVSRPRRPPPASHRRESFRR